MRKPPKNARYPHVCNFCGKKFVSAKRVQQFCSHVCCTKNMHNTQQTRRECPHCGVEFWGVAGKVYCSVKCRQAAKWRRMNPKEQPPTPTPTYGFWGI